MPRSNCTDNLPTDDAMTWEEFAATAPGLAAAHDHGLLDRVRSVRHLQMRNWTYAGAEGVLRLRAALQEGSYARLWQQRLQSAA